MQATDLIRGLYGGLAGAFVFGGLMGVMGMLPTVGELIYGATLGMVFASIRYPSPAYATASKKRPQRLVTGQRD